MREQQQQSQKKTIEHDHNDDDGGGGGGGNGDGDCTTHSCEQLPMSINTIKPITPHRIVIMKTTFLYGGFGHKSS